MGQTVILTCDLHNDDTAAVETLRFAVGATGYEIELCEKHLKEFNDKLSAFTKGARSTSSRRSAATRGRPAAKARPGTKRRGRALDVSVVREWARDQGYEVSARGRIPGAILDAYKARGKG